jgi:hypothetical protein
MTIDIRGDTLVRLVRRMMHEYYESMTCSQLRIKTTYNVGKKVSLNHQRHCAIIEAAVYMILTYLIAEQTSCDTDSML